jgi:hypothetical protein
MNEYNLHVSVAAGGQVCKPARGVCIDRATVICIENNGPAQLCCPAHAAALVVVIAEPTSYCWLGKESA